MILEGPELLDIIRMNVSATGCLQPFIQTHAKVLERVAICVETLLVGSVYSNQLRYEVQYLTELDFLLLDLFLGALAIFDIGEDTIPLKDVSIFVSERHAALQMPAVLPIRAAETHFVLKNLACANAREPLAFVPLKIIRESCGMP